MKRIAFAVGLLCGAAIALYYLRPITIAHRTPAGEWEIIWSLDPYPASLLG